MLVEGTGNNAVEEISRKLFYFVVTTKPEFIKSLKDLKNSLYVFLIKLF